MTYRILVTGSRGFTARALLEKTLMGILARANTLDVEIWHGGCPSGADQMAHDFCLAHRIPEKVFPADWNGYGKAAGPMRNEKMAKAGPDLCAAFPAGLTPGTRHMIECAIEYGIRTLITPQVPSEQP